MFTFTAHGEVVDCIANQTKAGKTFHKVVIKDHFDKRLQFTMWPDDEGKRVKGNIEVGSLVCVHGVLDSQEYNEKYYTDAMMTRVEVLGSHQPPKVSTPKIVEPDFGDIPF